MKTTFDEFFRAVHGYAPFKWQCRLAKELASGEWPDVLDVPTGAGKTSLIDIALYELVRDGGQSVPRRIVLVVDRRVIVDQVGERALKIRKALESPTSPAAKEVAERLREIVGPGAPLLQSAVLRGASVRDDAWAKWPQVPVIAASTVDQVGSRLFFRGYGVSNGMRPVHAGLIGCDTLLLLDEVHLSRPFADVLEQLERLRRQEGEGGIPRRFRMVQLSATPHAEAAKKKVFSLTRADREGDDEATRKLDRRLSASKPARLVRVEVKANASEEAKRTALAEASATYARELLEKGRRAVAVVVNRVDTARRTWTLLHQGANAPCDCVLITGRMRPLDQSELILGIRERVLAGREESTAAKPIVVVTTQCIEAGADFDFEAMVTECASLDALRQRFGRVDRLGGRGSESVILCRTDLLGRTVDPVYGQALSRTFEWLESIASESKMVDFGIDVVAPHIEKLGDKLAEYCAPTREAPVLLPAYLDQWAQTQPRPYADPDVSLFLHGIPEGKREALPDVQVVFRADVTDEDLQSKAAQAEKQLVEALEAVPPGSLEALSLPVWTVRSWLTARSAQADETSDVEGLATEEEPTAPQYGGKPVFVWFASDESRRGKICPGSEIAPGDVVVVPTSYGGIGPHKSFDPGAKAEDFTRIVDLGDVVQLHQRGRASLRLDERVIGPFLTEEAGKKLAALRATSEEELELDDVRALLEALIAGEGWNETVPPWLAPLRNALGSRPRLVSRETATSRAWLAISRKRLEKTPSVLPIVDDTSDSTTEEDEGSFLGSKVTLDSHLRGVASLAARLADRLSWPDKVKHSVEWAARLHDVGKADPRFQLMLYGGDEIDALSGKILAKSPIPRQAAQARRLARERAGYPAGQRHELVSLAMIERSSALREKVEASGADWELVLHLVASHHGWCRPFAPALGLEGEGDPVSFVVDGLELRGNGDHGSDHFDSGVADRFFRLMKRYGWHELAYAEAVMRLSDHRQSEMEQGG
ncbi:MAG: type I-U CRISPR-associated helicase/endonuclease Cas3 [Pseudomonadota bacterium]|nr:MAG: CRISPR-associated endonuclease Cas3'' [Pseudomonadota bacterium]